MLEPTISLWSKGSDLPGFSPMLERLREYKYLIKEEKMSTWDARIFDIDSDYRPTRCWEFPWALAFLGDKSQRILNVSETYDPLSLLLKDLGHSVTVAGRYSRLLDDINRRFAKRGIQYGEHDMTNLPFPDREFDIVFCCCYSQYSREDYARKMMSELLRVVKPGNPCIITTGSMENTKWLVPDFDPPNDVMMLDGMYIAGAVFEKEKQ